LRLADRGYRVFPLRVEGWTPALEGWQTWATTDPDVIREKWFEQDYNIGVATGDDLLVADVDDKPGKNGSASLAMLGLDLEDYDTFTVRTPTGGRHLYYRGPDVSNSASRLGLDLDVRSKGGYVVGPGSFIPDGAKNAKGGTYEVENDTPPRPVPECISSRLHAPPERSARADVPAIDLDRPDAVIRAIDWLQAQPVQTQGHGCDAATFQAVATIKDYGLSEATALQVMLGHYRCAPQDHRFEAFIARKVENAYAYGRLPAGIDHPVRAYEGVNIQPPAPMVRSWFDHGDDWRGSVSWLYHGVLPTTGVCILTAPSQAGKTFVALDLAWSLAEGRPFFGIEPEDRGGSILLVGEAFGSVKLRLAALAGDKPLPITSTYVGGLAAAGAWAALRVDLSAKAAQMAAQHGVPVRLVVLDTLSASGILDDENDNAKAATVLKAMADLATAMGVLFLVIHHPPKSGVGERGAGAIRNNADYVMEVVREGNAKVREVQMNKSRDGEQRVLGSFTLQPVEIGRDEKGRPITTMILSPGEARVREAAAMSKDARLVVECVSWAMDGPPNPDDTDYRDTVEGVKMVEAWGARRWFDTRADGSRDSSNLKKRFDKALSAADDAGVITVVNYAGRKYLAPKEII
jgi:hypothetical protein